LQEAFVRPLFLARRVLEQERRQGLFPANPIKQLFAKLKALLRKAATRTIKAFWAAVSALLPATPTNAQTTSPTPVMELWTLIVKAL
jgi:hypothetical protein